MTVNGPGLVLTLSDLAPGINATGIQGGAGLVNEGGGVWRLNANLRIGAGVTLELTPPAVSLLKIRSESTPITDTVDPTSYAYLEAVDGAIKIETIQITSWGATGPDTTPANGRAFIRALGASRMDITSSTIGFLGNPDGGGASYGLSWRDDFELGGRMATRVTGNVINSDIHNLYFGFYSFGASGMLIENNRFHDNYSYGFDPHDFSHGFFVIYNLSYNNGNHGFIISRGCHHFVFRGNKSFGNTYRVDSKPFRAHGFMLDPGGLTSPNGPYTPSHDNVLENNEAYGNQGYGIRVLDANDNTLLNNFFHHNLRGISVERASAGNTIASNRVENNTEHGIAILDTAEGNFVLVNTISGNGRDGLALADNARHTLLEQNNVARNGQAAIRAGVSTTANFWRRNSIAGNAQPIVLGTGANGGINAPLILGHIGAVAHGTAAPNAVIDVFSDSGGQGEFHEGSAVADAAGRWSLTLAAQRRARISAIASVSGAGSSAFSGSVAAGASAVE